VRDFPETGISPAGRTSEITWPLSNTEKVRSGHRNREGQGRALEESAAWNGPPAAALCPVRHHSQIWESDSRLRQPSTATRSESFFLLTKN